jgi:hypothetical protein
MALLFRASTKVFNGHELTRHCDCDLFGAQKPVVDWRYYGAFLCVHSDELHRVSFNRLPPFTHTYPRVGSLHLHCGPRLNVHGKIHGNAGLEPRGIQYIGDSQCHGFPQRSLFACTWDGGHQRTLRELGSPSGHVDPGEGSTVRF